MKRVLELTSKGLYCPAGNFYIDPSSKVETAIVTHAHSDHARRGSVKYVCNEKSLHLLKSRLAKKAEIETRKYGEKFVLGSALVSLHPAGHILGSSQIRVQVGNEVWVVSGDYKRDVDPTCDSFEVIKCNTFITEATFGLPQYEWPASKEVVTQILNWWERNKRDRVVSVIYCYSIGKAQRLIAELNAASGGEFVCVHPVIAESCECYKQAGVKLDIANLPEKFNGTELVIAPPSANRGEWLNAINKYETAFASGWMLESRTGSFGRGFNEGFVLSDHADWPALLRTVLDTQAKNVYVTHGYAKVLVRELRSLGVNAAPLETLGAKKSKLKLLSKMQMTLSSFIQ